MVEEPLRSRSTLMDVLDRVLDKGIVVDARVRVSVAGLHLLDVNARLVVASIETYLAYSDLISATVIPSAGAPAPGLRAREEPGRSSSDAGTRGALAGGPGP